MKKNKFITLIIACAALFPLAVNAAEFRAAEEAALNAGETANGNLYMAGATVTEMGTVKGDLVAGGGTILINGPVQGDLLIGGGNITVSGDVAGDTRIGGGNIVLSSKVAGDLIVGGGQIVVSGQQIGGDVAVAGGNINLSAPITGNLKVAGGQVMINAPIKGNVIIHAEKITLGPKANIQGDLTYTSGMSATMQTGALVHGKTNFIQQESSTTKAASGAVLGAILTFALLAKLMMAILAAFVLFWIFPRFAHELTSSFGDKPLENLGRGFVALIMIPVTALVLLITVIGIPLGLMVIFGYVALMIFVSIATPVAIGSLVHKWIWKPAQYQVNWMTILIGVVIYFLLTFIPFAGWIVKFIAVVMTLGVVTQITWSVVKSWR